MWGYNVIIFVCVFNSMVGVFGNEEIFIRTLEDPSVGISPAPPLSVFYPTLMEVDANNQYRLIDDPKWAALDAKKINKEIGERKIPILWALAFIVISLICLTAKWVISYYRDSVVKLFAPTPYKKALKALHKLEKLGLPRKNMFTEFYSRISFIVRRFLEEHFQLKIMALTTQEFLDHPVFKKEIQQKLQRFLQHADLVKFAHHEPTVEECDQMQQAARELIEDAAVTSL